MTDLLHTIPDFPTKTYTHLFPSLEKHCVTTADLLTLDAVEIARRAQLPVLDIRRLANQVIEILGGQLGLAPAAGGGRDDGVVLNPSSAGGEGGGSRKSGNEVVLDQKWSVISTLDDSIDAALGGGIPTGYITEFTGESGTGKTQFLLTLLLSAQLPAPHGLSRPTLYISTEHPLPTSRLTQLLVTHPVLLAHHSSPPSLSRILTLQTPDLESQDHILTYQLPVALARHRVGLCIIDSVAANYRAERPDGHPLDYSSPSTLAYRSNQLIRLGALLRSLARNHDCAIVVANQVSDRFPPAAALRPPHLTPPPPPSSREPSFHNFTPLLSLDHQQRFFTGWGADPASPNSQLKTPSLGPVWTNQIACRIALIKQQQMVAGRIAPPHADETDILQGNARRNIITENGVVVDDENSIMIMKMKEGKSATTTTKRWMRVVFAPWVRGTSEKDKGVEFEIWSGGVRGIGKGIADANASESGYST